MKISYNKIVIFVVTICFISVSAVIFYSLFDKSHEDNAYIRFQKRQQEYLSNLNDKKLIEIKDKELEALVSEFIDMDIDEEKKQIYNNKLPEEKYFNDNIKVVYNDICNGTTYYIKNVTQSETRNYQTIVNSTIEEKATFMTFFTYYFTYAAKFCAYMGNYKNIKQYLDDNDRFSYHDSVERAVEYSLCALYNTYTNDMYMVVDGDDEGCDLGGLITNYYWMNVGPAPEWNNNIIYWLAHEGYDQICDAYCEKYNYGKGGVVRYRIKGGVLSTMMRDLEIFGDNAPGEFPMDDIWVQQFDYADIKHIYDRWVKHLVNRI